ncbi:MULTISPECIES: hypothetical protein [Citrobacter]|uniref:hypothetical protein n=1 Tax=Citrobacter TaxID=544 RepID=UPI000456708C|nr:MULTISPECIES: hypothetical protein [Citrobacter]AHY14022.1 hypothetical protein CFNIH1_21575 [Citrobacter freundii CFNIH1]MBJ8368772.1 hypothetical protein [Citrobacter cronae]MBJ8396552.1 hypothetical protein [Citrobacter cronae]MBQ4923397.1 hypothetical protein [Citrobacter werkmanii]MBQ4964912.1 hypothetical protein [Citrobacter werkmanii]
MGLISHKFSDLINLDVKEGRRRNAKRGNYRDFSGAMPVQPAPMLSLSQIKMISFKAGAKFIYQP